MPLFVILVISVFQLHFRSLFRNMLKLSFSLEIVLLGVAAGIKIPAPRYDKRIVRKKYHDMISMNRFASVNQLEWPHMESH